MKRKMISVALCTAMVASMMAGTAVTASAEEKEPRKFAYTCMDGTNPFFVTIEKAIVKQ